MDSSTLYDEVQKRYSSCARDESGNYATSVAKAFGYSEDELQSIPKDANLGLSCGNPTALANLREGETVVDLGSGAGLDVFLSATKVGPNGRAIGIDRNKDMLARANENKARIGAENIEFVESPITQIALPPGTADCVISNCVINLVPESEKHLVFKEIFRILKPGGRVAVSDILAKKPLPEDLKKDLASYVGCISGASLVEMYRKYFQDAGFVDVAIIDSDSDLNVYTETARDDGSRSRPCCSPGQQTCSPGQQTCSPESMKKPGCCAEKEPGACNVSDSVGSNVGTNRDLNAWVGSYKIFAIKSLSN